MSKNKDIRKSEGKNPKLSTTLPTFKFSCLVPNTKEPPFALGAQRAINALGL